MRPSLCRISYMNFRESPKGEVRRIPFSRTSENAIKRKSNFRERFPSNKRSVRMFPATSGGKGSHVLPTSRRPRFVLISFGSEESWPSGLPHLQPNQYDLAQRCTNRRV